MGALQGGPTRPTHEEVAGGCHELFQQQGRQDPPPRKKKKNTKATNIPKDPYAWLQSTQQREQMEEKCSQVRNSTWTSFTWK